MVAIKQSFSTQIGRKDEEQDLVDEDKESANVFDMNMERKSTISIFQ